MSIYKLLRRLLNGGVPLIGKADGTETLIEFRDFLAWLTHKCFSELGPGSNFARRFVSLQFLKLVHETVGLESANPGDLASSIHLSRPAVFSLVDCFFDSYDVIKDLALSLLQTPSLLTVMNEVGFVVEILNLPPFSLIWSSCCWGRTLNSPDWSNSTGPAL